MGPITRKTILLVIAPILLSAQSELYPPESFYGGGVGFSRMFLFMEVGKLEGFELLGTVVDTAGDSTGLGLATGDFIYPFTLNGGEGFSHLTGRWRIGGYAGVGSSFISGKPTIKLFLDENGNGEFEAGTERWTYYDPSPGTGNLAPDMHAKVSVLISGATVEYVFPLFRGLEVSTGALLGLGRMSLSISQSSGSPSWNEQFTSIFQIGADGYYPVTDVNGDSLFNDDDFTYVESNLFSTIAVSQGMTSRTGTFFNMQPYLAIKLQFLDRMGLRLSVGFNLGKISRGTWATEDRKPIIDSPSTSLNSVAIRTMIYFGL